MSSVDLSRLAMINDPAQAIRDLIQIFSGVAKTSYPKQINSTFNAAIDHAVHGEWGLGLEILCENLFEYDVPVPRKAFDQITSLARSWGIDSNHVDVLKPLVIPEE